LQLTDAKVSGDKFYFLLTVNSPYIQKSFNIFTNLKSMFVVEIRMKSAAAGKTRFFDPPRMIFAA
jgi:hypothetical protein